MTKECRRAKCLIAASWARHKALLSTLAALAWLVSELRTATTPPGDASLMPGALRKVAVGIPADVCAATPLISRQEQPKAALLDLCENDAHIARVARLKYGKGAHIRAWPSMVWGQLIALAPYWLPA